MANCRLVNLVQNIDLINVRAKYKCLDMVPVKHSLPQISALLKKKVQNFKFNQHILNENHFCLRDCNDYKMNINQIWECINILRSNVDKENQEKQVEYPSQFRMDFFNLSQVDTYLQYNYEIQLSNLVNSVRSYQKRSFREEKGQKVPADPYYCCGNLRFLVDMSQQLTMSEGMPAEICDKLRLTRNADKAAELSQILMEYTLRLYGSDSEEQANQLPSMIDQIRSKYDSSFRDAGLLQLWKILYF